MKKTRKPKSKKQFRVEALPKPTTAEGFLNFAKSLEHTLNRLSRNGYAVSLRDAEGGTILVGTLIAPNPLDTIARSLLGVPDKHSESHENHAPRADIFSKRTDELITRFDDATPALVTAEGVKKVAGTCLQGFSVLELEEAGKQIAAYLDHHGKACEKGEACESTKFFKAVLDVVQSAKHLSIQ